MVSEVVVVVEVEDSEVEVGTEVDLEVALGVVLEVVVAADSEEEADIKLGSFSFLKICEVLSFVVIGLFIQSFLLAWRCIIIAALPVATLPPAGSISSTCHRACGSFRKRNYPVMKENHG